MYCNELSFQELLVDCFDYINDFENNLENK